MLILYVAAVLLAFTTILTWNQLGPLERAWCCVGLFGQGMGVVGQLLTETQFNNYADAFLYLCVGTSPLLANQALLIYALVTIFAVYGMFCYYGRCLLTGAPWSTPAQLLAPLIIGVLVGKLFIESNHPRGRSQLSIASSVKKTERS